MSNEVMTLLARLEGDPKSMVDAFQQGGKAMNEMSSTATKSANQAQSTYSTMSDGIKKSLLAVGGALAAAFSIHAIADWAGEAIKQLGAIEVANAQTAAVLHSTGSEAWTTATHIQELSESLEKQTATSHETIQAGENMLLTFKNIQNQAGAGNDIFDQSTKVLVDMGRAMGEDLPTAAIRLGKALNDPVAGIGALARVGVQFTDSQKTMIKSLVDAGDTMQAQKIILAELNSEFGGSGAAYANTYTGSVERLHQAFNLFSQTLFSGLMPLLKDMAKAGADAFEWLSGTSAVTSFGGKLASAFEGAWAAVKPVLSALGTEFGPILSTLGPQVLQLVSAFSPLGLVLKALTPVLPLVESLLQQVASVLSGALSAALPTITSLVSKLASILSGALAQALPMIIDLVENVGGVMTQLMPSIMQVVGALGSALMTALKALLPAFLQIVPIVGQLFDVLTPIIPPVLQIVEAFLPLVGVLGQLIASILPPVVQLLSALLGPILQLVAPLLQLLVPGLQVLAEVLTIVVTWITQAIQWLVKMAAESDKNGTSMMAIFKDIGNVVGTVFNFISGVIQTNTDNMVAAFKWIMTTVGQVQSTFRDVFSAIGGFISSAFTSAISIVKGAVNGIISLINGVIGAIDNLHVKIPDWVPLLGGQTFGVNIPKIPMLAGGGTAVAPGMAWVGENGPELLHLPTGASVVPLDKAATVGTPAGDGKTDLSDETIDKLARALAAQRRVNDRQDV